MNMVTKSTAANALFAYMRHELSLLQLVDWAENTLWEANFSDEDMDPLAQVLSRLGLADVCAFGLSWEDCESLVKTLGYKIQVQLLETV